MNTTCCTDWILELFWCQDVFLCSYFLCQSNGEVFPEKKMHISKSSQFLSALRWALTACPVLLCDPKGRSPVVVPFLPITAYRLTQNLPHHFHIAAFHCFHCCVWCESPPPPLPLSFSLTCFLFSLLPLKPSCLYTPSCPPGSVCSTSAAAMLAKNRCPRNTSPVREKEQEKESGGERRR